MAGAADATDETGLGYGGGVGGRHRPRSEPGPRAGQLGFLNSLSGQRVHEKVPASIQSGNTFLFRGNDLTGSTQWSQTLAPLSRARQAAFRVHSEHVCSVQCYTCARGDRCKIARRNRYLASACRAPAVSRSAKTLTLSPDCMLFVVSWVSVITGDGNCIATA